MIFSIHKEDHFQEHDQHQSIKQQLDSHAFERLKEAFLAVCLDQPI